MYNSSMSYDCNSMTLSQSHFEHLVRSQISPVVIIITFLTNALVSIILTRPHMISPTNIILLGIAISNLLNGIVPLPIYLAKLNSKFIINNTISKAFANYYLTVIFPTIFHTASVWLTVVLALQRYLYIIFPVNIHHYWTIKSSRTCVYLIYIASIFSHSITFMIIFDEDQTKEILKCGFVSDTILMVYYWLRVSFINIIPCLILSILTILIIRALGETNRNRQRLLQKSSRKSNSTKRSETISNSISKMLLVVLIIFLTVEIPAGATIATYTAGKTFDADLNDNVMAYLITTCDLVVLMSYPFNCVVYYIMSEQFRNTFSTIIYNCSPNNNRNSEFNNNKLSTLNNLDQKKL